MAGKDRVFSFCPEESRIDNVKNDNEDENRGPVMKTSAVKLDKDNLQKPLFELNVFERNYQYARIYDNRRSALKAQKEEEESSHCHFKASPMLISNPPKEQSKFPKFTVPNTPEVLKRERGPRT
ncbi:uncharacterized protein LOC128307266 [Anopheles moucheti]|uniref:uncharacterized protein LOC128307266 n=1 Tax=Anopheles moucheti TaxID=186751 RepID=UPI0022F05F48|nr:uncharacterized protein LOC128307266 [Anopheles moucheti]